MRTSLFGSFLAGFILCGLPAPTTASPLLNGDFSIPGSPPNPFFAWTTEPTIGDPPTDGGGFALFTESPTRAIQLQQTFDLPADAGTLSFDFRLTSSGTPVTTPPDSFQATLYDTAFNPLFPYADPLFPGFFSIDNTGLVLANPAVSITSLAGGYQRVTLDLAGLTLPQNGVTLEFLLNASDDGVTTTVELDNVTVTNRFAGVPEPASLLLVGLAGAAVLAARGRARRAPAA